MGRSCSQNGRSAFKILTSTPIGKRPLGRPRHRQEANIIMNLEEIVSIGGIGLIWLRAGIYWEAYVTGGMGEM